MAASSILGICLLVSCTAYDFCLRYLTVISTFRIDVIDIANPRRRQQLKLRFLPVPAVFSSKGGKAQFKSETARNNKAQQ